MKITKLNSKQSLGVNITESLKEDLNIEEVGTSALLNNLIQQEYELLNQYDSAQVTLESHEENRFSEIFNYIADDISIHIGMLQAALEDVDPSTEKVDDGKQEAEKLLL